MKPDLRVLGPLARAPSLSRFALLLALALPTAALAYPGGGDAQEDSVPFNLLQRDSIVRLDVARPEQSLWISYPGALSGVCGIRIKGTHGLHAKELEDAIELVDSTRPSSPGASPELIPLTVGKSGVLESGNLWGRTKYYGAMLRLRSKDGGNLQDVFRKLAQSHTSQPVKDSPLVIVEAKECSLTSTNAAP